MALLIQEGFEFSTSWNAVTYGDQWSVVDTFNNIITTPPSGRSGNALYIDNSENQTINFGTPATVITGSAFYFETDSAQTFVRLRDGISGTIHIELRRVALTGVIDVYRGDGTLLGSTATGVPVGSWHHVQLKATISNASGVVVIKIDNIERLNLTSQDTQNGANAYCSVVGLHRSSSMSYYVDDFWVCDTSTAFNNDFVGDCKIGPLLPIGAGNYSQWTPSAGSNWQNVDDSTPDSDTTYNSDSVSGNKDTYTHAALGVTGSVLGVLHRAMMRKDDAGAVNARLIERINGTDYNGGDIALGNSYQTYSRLLQTNPDTSALWTVGQVDSAEPGQEIRP